MTLPAKKRKTCLPSSSFREEENATKRQRLNICAFTTTTTTNKKKEKKPAATTEATPSQRTNKHRGCRKRRNMSFSGRSGSATYPDRFRAPKVKAQETRQGVKLVRCGHASGSCVQRQYQCKMGQLWRVGSPFHKLSQRQMFFVLLALYCSSFLHIVHGPHSDHPIIPLMKRKHQNFQRFTKQTHKILQKYSIDLSCHRLKTAARALHCIFKKRVAQP